MNRKKLIWIASQYPYLSTITVASVLYLFAAIYLAFISARDGETSQVIFWGISALAVGAILTGYFSKSKNESWRSWRKNYLHGISTELTGAIITTIVLGLIITGLSPILPFSTIFDESPMPWSVARSL